MNNKKRAVVEVGLVQLLGIVLAVVLIIGTIWFFARLTGILTGGGEERATEVSFQTLASTLKEFASQTDSCIATQTQNMYISSDYAIIAFNKQQSSVQNTCSTETIQHPQRPDCPSDKVCLCMYKSQNDINIITPLQCIAINAESITMQNYASSNDQKILKQDLLIFGQCNPHWHIFGGPKFGTQKLYIEKHTQNNKNTILIDTTNDRQLIQKMYDDCTKNALQSQIM